MSATVIENTDVVDAAMNAVVIYEERETARRANALLQRASARADAATRWSVKPWRLDLLEWGPLGQEALRDATEAHLMLLALGSEPEELPHPLLDWLEMWARCRQVQGAALAVFNGGSGDALSSSATPVLSEFAQRHGLSLILGEVDPRDDISPGLWEDLREREVAQTPTMTHILEQVSARDYHHWGINE
jgi:hypothetical protein